MQKETMKVGPFTWRRDDHGEDEAWELVLPKNLRVTYFCVKNYGGQPTNESFSGWRLVSGGPFAHVGGWTNRYDAMKGVIKFLIGFYRKEAKKRLTKARRIMKMTEAWLKKLEKK